jgi:putative DNA-invertase from lambdoid prophage Rac
MNTDYLAESAFLQAGIKRIVGYVRVSDVKQERSPAAQEKMIREIATPSIPVQIFGDQDSAFRKSVASREGGAAMLKDIREGDVVVVCDIDRLGRNTLDLMTTVAWLQKQKVRVYDAVLRQFFELETPEGLVLNGLRCILAEWESKIKSARITRIARYLKSIGKPYHARPRFGFIRLRKYRPSGRPYIEWEWNQAEWDQCEFMVKLNENGHLGIDEIAVLMNKRLDWCWDSGNKGKGERGRGKWTRLKVWRRIRWYKEQMGDPENQNHVQRLRKPQSPEVGR